MNKRVILYSASLCGDCQRLKRFMDERGMNYELRDIKENPDHARELERATEKLGVPYLVLDGKWVPGYESGQPFSEEFAERLLGLGER